MILCLIPFILAGGRVREHYDHQIIEVLEQSEESEKTIEVSKIVLRAQNLSLYGTVKEVYSYSEFTAGLIKGTLFFDYYFDDGSVDLDQVDIEDFYEHRMPVFIKGKYKIRSGEIIEKDSSKKLSVGDFTDEDFNYQYEWLSFARNLDPINTKAYFSKKTSNGKVTRYNEVPYNIKMIP